MDVNSVNNSSIYGTQSKTEERKPQQKAEETQASSSQPVDRLELSEEAKLSKLMGYNTIKDRIKSGFYENPEVLKEVALRLSRELPVEAEE